jgi:hypothetical protein
VLGGDDVLRRQYDAGVRHVLIGLGGPGDKGPRRRLCELARGVGAEAVAVRHPAAVVFGVGAAVIEGVRIGAHALVGAGATVIRDVEPATVVVGVPARVVRRVER